MFTLNPTLSIALASHHGTASTELMGSSNRQRVDMVKTELAVCLLKCTYFLLHRTTFSMLRLSPGHMFNHVSYSRNQHGSTRLQSRCASKSESLGNYPAGVSLANTIQAVGRILWLLAQACFGPKNVYPKLSPLSGSQVARKTSKSQNGSHLEVCRIRMIYCIAFKFQQTANSWPNNESVVLINLTRAERMACTGHKGSAEQTLALESGTKMKQNSTRYRMMRIQSDMAI